MVMKRTALIISMGRHVCVVVFSLESCCVARSVVTTDHGEVIARG